MKFTRRRFLNWMTIAIGSSATVAEARKPIAPTPKKKSPISVGILHSLSGSMAISERSAVDAELLAIKEINQSGGVLGRQIVPQIRDGASDWTVFAQEMKALARSQVATVFGGWTSASRKSMLPHLEKYGQLLWYPLTYEGQECSKNVMYTGLVPNQFINSMIDWAVKTYPDKPFCLLGSDYVFPRWTNAMVRLELERRKIPILMEDYFPLGDVETPRTVVKILRKLKAEGGIIFSTINGDSNIPFYKDLYEFKLSPDRYPVISASISEEEVIALSPEYVQGNYSIASFFQTVNHPAGQRFVQAFKREYGEKRVVNDAMAAAYTAVYLWRAAVEKAGTASDRQKVAAAARGLAWDAPTGLVTVADNNHLSQPVRIGTVRSDGLFDIVFESDAIAPNPWRQDDERFSQQFCE